jgi:hypothetical protein
MRFKHSIFIVVGLSSFALNGVAQSSLEGFSTGRYEIRSGKKSRTPASEEVTTTTSVVAPATAVTVVEKSVEGVPAAAVVKEPRTKKAVVVETPAAAPVVVAVEEKTVAKDAMPAVKPPPAENLAEEPGISSQAHSLFNDGTQKVLDFYKEQIHEDDIRNNRLEIEVSPTAVYNDSSSNYSFREYQSFFSALKVRANVWLTPLIGVSGQILFSFAADVDSVIDSSRVGTKYEFMDLGLNFRKFFGMSRKANSLELSVLYNENKMTPASDNTSRAKLTSNGLGVGMKARLPTSFTYAWVLGGSFFPRLQHGEGETGININSGSMEESARIGVDLGGEWKFDRESQLIWNLGLSSERNVFDGAASLPDPSTGTTPNNVSVTNTLYMFSLGYRWGH